MCIAHHLRMMKHTLSTQSNLRRLARLIFANRVGCGARLFGTFGLVAQKVAVGCLHEQQQHRTYTGLTTRDVLVHDNCLTETRTIQVPATCHSAHVSLCHSKQLHRSHSLVSLGAMLGQGCPERNAHHTSGQATDVDFYGSYQAQYWFAIQERW